MIQFSIILFQTRFSQLFIVHSSLEPYRRFRLVFYTNVLLSSEAWIQRDDGQLHFGSADLCVCCMVCHERCVLR